MMLNNIFSIPVHEKTEVVIDQIINCKYFAPDCGIVLHLSKGFDFEHSFHSRKEFLSILKTFDNVFVNPTSFDTMWADIVQTHASNFKYVSSVADFKYFSLIASNELFVRSMPEVIAPNYDISCGYSRWIDEEDNRGWHEYVKNDVYIHRIVEYFNGDASDICRSQIEGSVYSRKMFGEIVEVIDRFYNFNEVAKTRRVIYPREEYYYTTIAHLLKKDIRNAKNVFTWMPSCKPNVVASLEQINDVAAAAKEGKYAIKRVARNFNDPMRFHIGAVIGKYRNRSIETVKMMCSKKSVALFNLVAGKQRIFVGHEQVESFIRNYFKIRADEMYIPLIERDGIIFLDNVVSAMFKNKDALFVICTPNYPMMLKFFNGAGFREDVNFIDGWFLLET